MLRRLRLTSALRKGSGSVVVIGHAAAVRTMNEYGWQFRLSTRDSRSREQREEERKQRQLEKLPRPEALHDFQYPLEKTILSDQLFQPPVYEDELDTPNLFHLFPPSDFFLSWSVRDFDRTQYPATPTSDYRTIPSGATSAPWLSHCRKVEKYLKKHGVVPDLFERLVPVPRNVSFIFGDAALDIVSPRTYWLTAHAGNFIELKHLQAWPRLFAAPETEPRPLLPGSEPLYTAFMFSPDYPYRVAPNKGFFLHGVEANISIPLDGREAQRGTMVVPYVPPLPTEDAGTTRHICALFRQSERVSLKNEEHVSSFTFEERCNFNLHNKTAATAHRCLPLHQVERVISGEPETVAMIQTAWDIQVQEFYELVGLPEPRYWPTDVEDVLRYNALPPDFHRVSGRKLADGAANDGTVFHEHARYDDSMALLQHTTLSRHLFRGPDGKPLNVPKI